MEIKVKRTLVKSAPELWELADDLMRLEAWAGDLAGGPVEIEITDRRPGRSLSWRGAGSGANVCIALALADKGFGTSVEITAHHDSSRGTAGDALERLLDELGSPDRRPFARA
jgi:hypothetical protein